MGIENETGYIEENYQIITDKIVDPIRGLRITTERNEQNSIRIRLINHKGNIEDEIKYLKRQNDQI